MKKKAHSDSPLRTQAEEIAMQTIVPVPEYKETSFPEAIRFALHELRVHQIELEMQNEELSRTQAILDTARARYYDLYDLAPVGYFSLNNKGLILEANLTFATLLGVDRGTLLKQPFSRYICREDQDIHYHHFNRLLKTGKPQVCELRLLRKDGAEGWVQIDATAAHDSEGLEVFRVAVSDITARKLVEEQLRVLSVTDELTGLSNRRSFFLLAEQHIKMADRLRQEFILFSADMDGLKLINDTWGHRAGDDAIIAIANILRSTLRDSDIVARIGGDEFAGLMINSNTEDASAMVDRLQSEVETWNRAATKPFSLAVSIGLVQYDPQQPSSLENLLALADNRMYTAKKRK